MRTITFARQAERDRQNTPKERRVQIARELTLLAEGKRDTLDIVPLKGHKPWQRLRVGTYRVIFRETAESIEVARVVPRQELENAIRILSH